jgi:hypothetical protein
VAPELRVVGLADGGAAHRGREACVRLEGGDSSGTAARPSRPACRSSR